MAARVLFLTHEPPLPLVSGARMRSYHLMRELARRGHAVSLFALVPGDAPSADDAAALAELCERVELRPFRPSPLARRARLALDAALARPFQRHYFRDAASVRAAAQLVRELAPDAIVVGQLYMEPYLPPASTAATILDSHNVEARRVATMTRAGGLRAAVARRQRRPVAAHEAAVVARLGRTWAVSEEERAHFEALAPGRVDLVPNGVDCAALPPRAVQPPAPEVLFLGRMDYGPNVDGARHLLLDVLPLMRRRDAVVRIVGANPPAELARLGERAPLAVEVTGFVASTAPYLDAARLLAVPLRVGGGTRLKILEALARGVPVVTTTLGCEGIGLVHEHDALIADAPAEFARCVERLLEDDALCAALARNGRATVERSFDWSAIGAAAETSLAALLAQGPSRPSGAAMIPRPMGRPGRMAQARRRARHGAHAAFVSAAQRLGAGFYIRVDYPPAAENAPRYGWGRPPHPRLAELIGAGEQRYAATLADFLERYGDDLARIEVHAGRAEDPSWANDFLPGLDGVALYSWMRLRAPAHYVEIGSGNSTKFAARARSDEGSATRLTSIDPYPRAEIDALCDEVVRRPLESVELSLFERLGAGDILFFDGSHRVFTNSDVVAFFLDVLPAVPPGVLVGVHDVYLPEDYPPEIAERYYSEQYMLAQLLLAADDVEIELPASFVHRHPRLGGALDALWSRPQLAGAHRGGVAFWFTKRA